MHTCFLALALLPSQHSLWPWRVPTPKVQDSGVNISIPPALQAACQKILDEVGAGLYFAGVIHGVIFTLLVGLVLGALILIFGKVELSNAKGIGLTILAALAVGYVLQQSQTAPPAPVAPTKIQQPK